MIEEDSYHVKMLEKHGWKGLLILIIAVFFIEKCNAQDCGGTERWAIKVAIDDSAKAIDTNKIVDYTIKDMNNLVIDLKGKENRSVLEKTVIRIKCKIPFYIIEDDADFHLVMQDLSDSTVTMIAESPDPTCSAVQKSRFKTQIANVRKSILNLTVSRKKSKFYLQAGTYELMGILFFDKIHGQTGVAKNGVEIHPILKIERKL